MCFESSDRVFSLSAELDIAMTIRATSKEKPNRDQNLHRKNKHTALYLFGRRPAQPKDLVQLLELGLAGKERASGQQFGQKAAARPDVDRRAVGEVAEQEFGRAVPQCDLRAEGRGCGCVGVSM